MAHFLTDESFALASTHFRRLGRADEWGYWVAAVAFEFIPWNVSTIAGSLLGGAIPDPSVYGLDVVFPAAMAGLCLGLVTGRREAVAAGAGAGIGVVLALVAGQQVGIIAGGLIGPLIGMAVPGSSGRPRAGAVGRRHPGRDGMTLPLIVLWLLMWAVTYPSRAVPMLAPGIERLPSRALLYLRLVGPAVLAAIAASQTLVHDGPGRDAGPAPGRGDAGRARLHGDRLVAPEPAARAPGGRRAGRGPAGARPRLSGVARARLANTLP